MINGFLEQNLFELVTLEIIQLQISISMRCWGSPLKQVIFWKSGTVGINLTT